MVASNEYDIQRPSSIASAIPHLNTMSKIEKDLELSEIIPLNKFRKEINDILPNEYASFKYENKLNRKDELKRLLK